MNTSLNTSLLAEKVIEVSPAGILIADTNGAIVLINPQTERWFGYTSEELVGQSVETLVPAALRETHIAQRARFNAQATSRMMGEGKDLFGRRKDGSVFPIDISLHLIDSDGQRLILANILDATDRRQAESAQKNELQHAEDRLLKAERLAAIGQTVTGLAHESRNALQRACSCLDLLELDLETMDELSLISRIRRALDDLKRIYEEVKSYAAPIVLRRTKVDLKAICNDAFEDLKDKFGDHGHRLTIRCEAPEPTAVVDQHRIKQLIRNLFENSLAAAKDGADLTVTIERCQKGHSPSTRLIVSDRSGGMPILSTHRVFEPFFTTKQQGTGLGLAICRRIVDAHDGSIIAENNGAGGVTIEVTLPDPSR